MILSKGRLLLQVWLLGSAPPHPPPKYPGTDTGSYSAAWELIPCDQLQGAEPLRS
jgi:hypothetical protein